MRSINKIGLCFLVAIISFGCAYPSKQSGAKDERPTIAVQGAPAGARLFVDGLDMGDAAGFNGKLGVLIVEPGTHVVEVRVGPRVLHSERIYVAGGDTRVVKISGGL